jgi:predicted DNA-binding transcriptional regulator AlpA
VGLDNPKLMISLQAEVDKTAIYEGGAASVALTPLHPIIVRPRAIQSVIGVSKSEALRLEKTNANFPKRVKIGPRISGWLYAELESYFKGLPRISV